MSYQAYISIAHFSARFMLLIKPSELIWQLKHSSYILRITNEISMSQTAKPSTGADGRGGPRLLTWLWEEELITWGKGKETVYMIKCRCCHFTKSYIDSFELKKKSDHHQVITKSSTCTSLQTPLRVATLYCHRLLSVNAEENKKRIPISWG